MATQFQAQSIASSLSSGAPFAGLPLAAGTTTSQRAGPAAASAGGGDVVSSSTETLNGLASLVTSGITGSAGALGLSEEEGSLRLSAQMARLPVGLAVAVPVREFRVRNLLAMTPGLVIATQWGHGEDLPLSSADVQLAWSEFEVVDARLAVRVTRLA